MTPVPGSVVLIKARLDIAPKGGHAVQEGNENRPSGWLGFVKIRCCLTAVRQLWRAVKQSAA
jgi:hypothetical protein